MEFGLSQEQEFLRDTLNRFLGDTRRPATRAPVRGRRMRSRADGSCGRVWSTLGVPGLVIAEAHGGVGLTSLDAATVAQTLGHAIAPVPFVATAVMVPRAIARAGSAEQRSEWLPRLAAGEIIAGIACVGGRQRRARRREGHGSRRQTARQNAVRRRLRSRCLSRRGRPPSPVSGRRKREWPDPPSSVDHRRHAPRRRTRVRRRDRTAVAGQHGRRGARRRTRRRAACCSPPIRSAPRRTCWIRRSPIR